MSNKLFGDLVGLKASEKVSLEKLSSRNFSSHLLVSNDLARRTAELANVLSRQIALLITREGNISHVVLGSKNRVYLPDLGRFRLNDFRLRRLRLLVFAPEDSVEFQEVSNQNNLLSGLIQASTRNKKISAPVIAQDLITDLEKLRLDCVCLLSVDRQGKLAEVSTAYIEPIQWNKSLGKVLSKHSSKTAVNYYYARDFQQLNFDFDSFVSELEKRFSEVTFSGFDTSKEQALVVGVYSGTLKEAESSMMELLELARTAGVEVVDTITQRRRSIDPKTVVGKGKIEEIVLRSLDLGADLLIFDKELSPGQLRSITNLTELRVIDRSMLILDIFSQRAISSEGRIQVELAQLKYSLPRLTDKDSGLSRLTGGIGGRGPGETKLEITRRRARDRISLLEKKIEKIASERSLRRKRRMIRGVPVIALVGYTNAGKSSLLNAITKSSVFVEDKLFATLDASSRRMRFPNDKEIVFVDTVGFIRELPKELMQAFRATLEEVGEADLLLHVVDASNPEIKSQIAIVNSTLSELGYKDKPTLLVLNKVDLLSSLERKMLLNTFGGFEVSAITREGFEVLVETVQEQLRECFTGADPGRFTEIESSSSEL
jgi:GTP-binding protein HflX